MENTISLKKSIFIILFYFLGNFFLPFICCVIYGIVMGIEEIDVMSITKVSLLVTVGITLIVCFLIKDFLKKEISNFMIKFKQNLKRSFIGGCYLVFTGLIISSIISSLINIETTNNQIAIIENFNIAPFLLFLESVLAAPIIEEIIFRGIVFNKLSRKFSNKKAIIISSIIFAGLHFLITLTTGELNDLPFIISYFVMSVIINIVYIKTNSLFGGIIAHMLNNIFAFLSLLTL